MRIYKRKGYTLLPTALAWVLLFAPGFLHCQDEEDGPRPDPKTVEQVEQKWFDETNAKMLPEKYRNFLAGARTLVDAEKLYTGWTVKYSSEQAEKLGIEQDKDISKLEHDPKPFMVQLKGAEGGELDGHRLLVALYDSDGFSYPILYELGPSGPHLLLFGYGGCSEFHLLKPGKKARTFIEFMSSGCGSGHGESLYQFQKDGSLKKVAETGGWHSGIAYADVDGDGWMVILETYDEMSTPPGLLERLIKVKNYGNNQRVGGGVQHSKILKWDGETYSVVGEFYGFSEF